MQYLFAGILACFIVVLLAWAPPSYSILLPFCSVIWLGEAFRMGDKLPVSPQVVCVVLVIAGRLMRRRPLALLDAMVRNRPLLLFCVLFIGAFLYGVASSADAAVMKEDATSILYFLAIYALVAATPDLNVGRAVAGIVIVTSLAAIKVLYLYAVPVDASWLNDWQAGVEIGNSPLDSRIRLRGADVFFFLAAAFPVGTLLVKKQLLKRVTTLVPIILLGIGMFFSSTRSNWIGFGAMVIVQIAVLYRRKLLTARTRTGVLMGVVLLVGLMVALSIKQEYSVAEKVKLRFQDRDRDVSVQFRVDEAQALVDAVGSSFIFGLGLGAQYPDPNDYFQTASGWSHNGFLFLYLKMGLVGLLVYAAILADLFRRLWRICMTSQDPDEISLHLGFLGALVCLCVLSLTVNKNFAVSGAIFSGLALGMCHRLPRGPRSEQRGAFVAPRHAVRDQAPRLILGDSPSHLAAPGCQPK